MNIFKWLIRDDIEEITQAELNRQYRLNYWRGVQAGIRWGRANPDYRSKAQPMYPTPDHPNVISLAAHRSYVPKGAA